MDLKHSSTNIMAASTDTYIQGSKSTDQIKPKESVEQLDKQPVTGKFHSHIKIGNKINFFI